MSSIKKLAENVWTGVYDNFSYQITGGGLYFVCASMKSIFIQQIYQYNFLLGIYESAKIILSIPKTHSIFYTIISNVSQSTLSDAESIPDYKQEQWFIN